MTPFELGVALGFLGAIGLVLVVSALVLTRRALLEAANQRERLQEHLDRLFRRDEQ